MLLSNVLCNIFIVLSVRNINPSCSNVIVLIYNFVCLSFLSYKLLAVVTDVGFHEQSQFLGVGIIHNPVTAKLKF